MKGAEKGVPTVVFFLFYLTKIDLVSVVDTFVRWKIDEITIASNYNVFCRYSFQEQFNVIESL